MKKPITFTPDQRIVSLMRRPGGVSVEEALANANRRLANVRESCIAALDGKIEALARCASSDAADLAEAYAFASEIYSLAATFEVKELAAAAESLCDLLVAHKEAPDGKPEAARGMLEALRVHTNALRTLRRPDLAGDAAGRAAVVAGLRQVVAKAQGGKAR